MTEPNEQEVLAMLDELAADADRTFPAAGIAGWYAEFKTLPPEQQMAEADAAGAKILAEMREMHGLDAAGEPS